MKVLAAAADSVPSGRIGLEQLAWPLSLAKQTLGDVLSGKPAFFSWQELLQGHALPASQLRHFVEVAPKLDFAALQPGRAAEQGIHKAAADLNLNSKLGATVGLTGEVPMNDDQFSVIRNSALRDTLTAMFGVLIVLWLALRSWKLILSVFFSLMVGLAATAALGLAMVGSFNLISIAFFVLFVGLGVDFGIQFSVRYRTERHEQGDLRKALRSAAEKSGKPLALAAAATAVGFFAFLPTSYRGLSELGLIAGCGMLIAFACSITLVPAMLIVLNPPGEPSRDRLPAPRAARRFPAAASHCRHRRHDRRGAGRLAAAVASAVRFQPGRLARPHLAFGGDVSSIAIRSADQRQRCGSPGAVARTGRRHRQAPRGPSRSLARADAEQLRSRRPGAENRSFASCVAGPRPGAQSSRAAAGAERSRERRGDPDAALALSRAAAGAKGSAADDARDVAALLNRVADAAPAVRSKAEAAIVPPLTYDLDLFAKALRPKP